MSDEKGITVAAPSEIKAPIEMGKGGIVLKTIEDLYRISAGIHASGMAPKSLNSRDKVAVAILTGAEAGLSPMASVRSIYVVNGAPAWISKAARAQVLSSGLLKPGTKIEEGVVHADNCQVSAKLRCADGCYGFCRTWRNGDHESIEHKFSVADAKLANLWGKSGPWQEYHQRMLMHRSAGFHFDDCWQDVLMGLTTVDAMRDWPQAAFIREGEAIVTDAQPPGRDPLLPPASAVVVDVQEEALSGVEGGNEVSPQSDRSADPSAPVQASDGIICWMEGCERFIAPGANSDYCAKCAHSITSAREGETPTRGPFPSDEELRQSDPMDDPLPPRYVGDEEEPVSSEINLGAYRETPTATEAAAGEPKKRKKATRKKKEKALSSEERAEVEANAAVKAIDKELAAEKVAGQEAPFIATCSVEGCGKEFDPDKEPHWNREGVFRCMEHGPFPK